MKKIALFLFISSIFLACQKDGITPKKNEPANSRGGNAVKKSEVILTKSAPRSVLLDNPNAPTNNLNINLSSLEHGQVNRYLSYATNCEAFTADWEFTGDTLIVKTILDKEQLFFEEVLSSFSASVQRGAPNERVRYPVEIQSDKIVLKERIHSKLFFFYGSDYLHLLFPSPMPTLSQEGCKLFLDGAPFIGDEITKVASFEAGPIAFYDKTAVSCVPNLDLDAYLIYDEQSLYMSHTIVTSSFMEETSTEVQGWCLLEE